MLELIGLFSLTAHSPSEIIASVRKPLAIPAALLAACFALSLPGSLEGKSAQKPASKRSIQTPRKAAAPSLKRPSRKAGKQSVKRSTSRRSAIHQAAVSRKAAASRKKAVRIVHQNISGEVVLESIEIVSLEASAPAVYGPFLPVEPHDYPQLPCPPLDAVVTAELHETDAATPEIAEAQETLLEPSHPSLAKLARKVGSLFRPKSAGARVKPQDVDLSDLLSEGFLVPVEGVDAGKLRDSFLESRGKHAQHLAIDIGAPRGTPVLATADGEIARLSKERRGGNSIYQKDLSGQYLFFYCHLSRYAEGLEAGQKVARGDVIGYVGSTGRVLGGSHLHFSITRLPEEDGDFREGLAINPYLLFLAGVP